MALILLEGLDRTGKSTVAQLYKDQGYEVLHMGPPPKELSMNGYVGPSYLDQMVELLSSAATKDVVLDRTHYGELIWPNIFSRKASLNEEDFEILREVEESVGVTRILMHDPSVDAHWQRCVDNKEPLNKGQFLRARTLYERMAEKHGFEKKTLKDFVSVKEPANGQSKTETASSSLQTGDSVSSERASPIVSSKSSELKKLEKANAINDILSKRLIKSRGPVYDELENDLRTYLTDRLGRIFGEDKQDSFSKEEIKTLKLFCQRIKDKENGK